MGTISVVPCEEQSREKVTAIEALVTRALVSLPGVVQRFGNNNFHTAVPGPPPPTQLVGPESHVETTGQAESSVQPRERAMRWRVWRQTGRLLGASIKRPTK